MYKPFFSIVLKQKRIDPSGTISVSDVRTLKICTRVALREIEKKIGHTSQLSFCDLLPGPPPPPLQFIQSSQLSSYDSLC